MRAVAIDAHGGLEQIRLRTDWPEPAAGPGQAVVTVRACGLNYLDIFVLQGMPGLPVAMPRIPGGDIAGNHLKPQELVAVENELGVLA